MPMVNSKEEAERAVAGAKYPPQGIRSFGGHLHAMNYDMDPLSFFSRTNDEVFVTIQAESPQAIANADAILSTKGIDAVLIGPSDLLCQMHKQPKMESDDKEFVDSVRHVLETSKKHGIPAGFHVAGYEPCNRRLRQGFKFITVGSDITFMQNGVMNDARRIER